MTKNFETLNDVEFKELVTAMMEKGREVAREAVASGRRMVDDDELVNPYFDVCDEFGVEPTDTVEDFWFAINIGADEVCAVFTEPKVKR